MNRRAAILDRDGTLIRDARYLDRLDRLEFFPYSIDAVRALNRAGFAVVVATNQSGVGRGIVEESFVGEAHDYIAARLEAGGAHVDGWYYCPHHPEAGRPEYRIQCECRKPQPGMLHRAAAELNLDLSRSFVVGDKWHDIEAGNAAGTRSILVTAGNRQENETAPSPRANPSARVHNLIEAVTWILRQS